MTTTEERLRDAFAAAAASVRVPVADRRAVIARSRRRRLFVAGAGIASLLAGSAVTVAVTRPGPTPEGPTPDGPRTYLVVGGGTPGIVLVDVSTHRVIRAVSPRGNTFDVRDLDVSADGRRMVVDVFAVPGRCTPVHVTDVETGRSSEMPGSAGGSSPQFVGNEIAYVRVTCEPTGTFLGGRDLRVLPDEPDGPPSGRPVLARSFPAQFLHPLPGGGYAWYKAPDVLGCEAAAGVVVPQGRLVATLCDDRSSVLALVPDDPTEPVRVLAQLPEPPTRSLDADATGRHVLMVGESMRVFRWDEGGVPQYLPTTALRAAW